MRTEGLLSGDKKLSWKTNELHPSEGEFCDI